MTTYRVAKAVNLARQPVNVQASPWGVYRFDEDCPLGTIIGRLTSRKAAVATARLLAGWRYRVEEVDFRGRVYVIAEGRAC
jgi:hypothetical protein